MMRNNLSVFVYGYQGIVVDGQEYRVWMLCGLQQTAVGASPCGRPRSFMGLILFFDHLSGATTRDRPCNLFSGFILFVPVVLGGHMDCPTIGFNPKGWCRLEILRTNITTNFISLTFLTSSIDDLLFHFSKRNDVKE